MTYYALFHGYIVTANKDGSIPLNAKVVAQVYAADPSGALLKLIGQANANAHIKESA